MVKSYRIKNFKQFKNFIENFGPVNETAKSLKVPHSQISNIINKNTRPNSNTLLKIVTNSGKNLKEIGIEEYDLPKSTTRLKILLDENEMRQIDLVNKFNDRKELGITKSVISNWYNGNKEPTLSIIKAVAEYFNVHYLYLLGEINTKNITNQQIQDFLNINENAIENIKFSVNCNIYGDKIHKELKDTFGLSYIDIIDFIVSDKQLLDIFYLEAYRVLLYETDSNYKENFDELFNTTEINVNYFNEIDPRLVLDGMVTASTPYLTSQKLHSESILKEKIGRMFDNYTNNLLKKYEQNKNSDI